MRRYLEIFTVLGYITLYFIAVLLSVALAKASGLAQFTAHHLLLEELLQLALVLLMVFAASRSRMMQHFGLKQTRRGVLIWLSVGFVVNFLGFIILLLSGIYEVVALSRPTLPLAYFVVAMAIATMEEELFFRVLIAGHISRYFNAAATVLSSSAIFTVFHFPMQHGNYIGMMNIFLGGVLMSIAFLPARNVWYPWAFHFAWNVSGGLIFGFSVSGISFDSLITPELQGATELTGGTYGYEGSLIATVLLTLAVAGTFYFRRKTISVFTY